MICLKRPSDAKSQQVVVTGKTDTAKELKAMSNGIY
jgi:hypothetical protein